MEWLGRNFKVFGGQKWNFCIRYFRLSENISLKRNGSSNEENSCRQKSLMRLITRISELIIIEESLMRLELA